MKTYEVTCPVIVIDAGLVELNGEQARARLHRLIPVEMYDETGAGVYEVNQPVQFKRGEILRADADIQKSFAELLDEVVAASETLTIEGGEQKRRGRKPKLSATAEVAQDETEAEAGDAVDSGEEGEP